MLLDMRYEEILNSVTRYDNFSKLEADMKKKLPYLYLKRLLDVLISVTALLMLFPLFGIIAFKICVDDPKGKPIFRQNRVGKGGKLFKIYKFRTMYAYVSHNLPTNRREDPDAMITQYGRVLRKYSFTVLLEVDKKLYKPEYDDQLRQEFLHKFGQNTKFTIRHVDEIPRESSGKFRMIINNV
jgi:lipopolysaccharide/colanic/teichoic acid biosynthesis glycosyltransferase